MWNVNRLKKKMEGGWIAIKNKQKLGNKNAAHLKSELVKKTGQTPAVT